MTEQEVRRYLRQMKEEDSERAFHSFYNLCYDRLFRIACYFVKHEEWAQEIVLDVFMKLWEQRARLPEVNNIEDYCFILTKNASLNYLEKENRHPTLSSEQLPEVSGQADSPEDTLISEELFARYVKALDRLPERCREVFHPPARRETKLCTSGGGAEHQHKDSRRATAKSTHKTQGSIADGVNSASSSLQEAAYACMRCTSRAA